MRATTPRGHVDMTEVIRASQEKPEFLDGTDVSRQHTPFLPEVREALCPYWQLGYSPEIVTALWAQSVTASPSQPLFIMDRAAETSVMFKTGVHGSMDRVRIGSSGRFILKQTCWQRDLIWLTTSAAPCPLESRVVYQSQVFYWCLRWDHVLGCLSSFHDKGSFLFNHAR